MSDLGKTILYLLVGLLGVALAVASALMLRQNEVLAVLNIFIGAMTVLFAWYQLHEVNKKK